MVVEAGLGSKTGDETGLQVAPSLELIRRYEWSSMRG
jgi:hypothetical protein